MLVRTMESLLRSHYGESPEEVIKRSPRIMSEVYRVRDFLDSCDYDFSAIRTDSNGQITEVDLKSPESIERDKKCTCVDGAYYAYSKLGKRFGSNFLSIAPVVSHKKFSNDRPVMGIGHLVFLYQLKGMYWGFLGKSRDQALAFSEPVFAFDSSIAFSNQILEGYNRVMANLGQEFIGITHRIDDNDKNPQYFVDGGCLKVKKGELRSKGLLFEDVGISDELFDGLKI